MRSQSTSRRLRVFATVLVAWGSFAQPLAAAPFAKWLTHVSPDGKAIRIWAEGDEYSASFEAEDGHTILYDTNRLAYVYARRNETTGALEPTEFAVGDESAEADAFLAGIPFHLRDDSEAARRERMNRIAEADAALGISSRWQNLKSRARSRRISRDSATTAQSGPLMAPPSQPTTGTIVGLTVLVDFPIVDSNGNTTNTVANVCHPDITRDTMDALVNGEDFTGFGNASSVRKYFEDVSCGHLSYTNIVLGYFTAAYPRAHYDDTSVACGPTAQELIAEVLAQINANREYKSLLKSVTYSGNEFLALNVWFAGPEPSVWSKGLWPHTWELESAQYQKCVVRIGGRAVHFGMYQISPITTAPSIGVFCHENCHMICDFPDLYDYNYGYGGAAGVYYSLMSNSGTTNPPYVDAYLRAAAGWVEPVELPDEEQWIAISNRLDCVWKYTNPSNDKEYYLLENRQKSGRDSSIPAGGIVVWRCDEDGDNMYPTNLTVKTGENSYRQKCELSMEQADGLYELEQRKNWYDPNDVWRSGNTASGYAGVFNTNSVPFARWSDGTDAGIWLSRFSASGDVMKVYSGAATLTTGIPVPYSWLEGYPELLEAAGGDYEAAALASTGKTDGSGATLHAWDDYVSGTDPTDPNDTFKAFIEMDGGLPKKITWEPDLNKDGATRRIYTVWGRESLRGGNAQEWKPATGSLDGFRFFKVTAEMP